MAITTDEREALDSWYFYQYIDKYGCNDQLPRKLEGEIKIWIS